MDKRGFAVAKFQKLSRKTSLSTAESHMADAFASSDSHEEAIAKLPQQLSSQDAVKNKMQWLFDMHDLEQVKGGKKTLSEALRPMQAGAVKLRKNLKSSGNNWSKWDAQHK